jgi:hypothetical protein
LIRKSFQARSCVALLAGVNGLAAAAWIPTEGNKRMVNLGRFFLAPTTPRTLTRQLVERKARRAKALRVDASD